jgi:hypothetical protein
MFTESLQFLAKEQVGNNFPFGASPGHWIRPVGAEVTSQGRLPPQGKRTRNQPRPVGAEVLVGHARFQGRQAPLAMNRHPFGVDELVPVPFIPIQAGKLLPSRS